MEKEIQKELIDAFNAFNTLRKLLLEEPASVLVSRYMEEWGLTTKDEVEENIEHREVSTLAQAADKLGVPFDELNAWLCKHI